MSVRCDGEGRVTLAMDGPVLNRKRAAVLPRLMQVWLGMRFVGGQGLSHPWL